MAATCAVEYYWVKMSRKADGEHCSGSKSGVVQKFGRHVEQNHFLLYPSFHNLQTRRILLFFPLLFIFLKLPNFHPYQSVRQLTPLHHIMHVHTQICACKHTHPHRHSTCSYGIPKKILSILSHL